MCKSVVFMHALQADSGAVKSSYALEKSGFHCSHHSLTSTALNDVRAGSVNLVTL